MNTGNAAAVNIGNLTNGMQAEVGAVPTPDMPPVGNTDTSLLHQVTRLQTEKQEWLQKQRELENRVKESEDLLLATKEAHAKEHAEFIEKQKMEMEEQFKNFMEEWMQTMSKESPEVVEQVKEGAKQLINNGKSKDRVWELLCCASRTHKTNVNTIEELRKANNLLSTQNHALEEVVRTSGGFSDPNTRMASGKRPRVDDTVDATVPHARTNIDERGTGSASTSDVWGQFEQLMSQGSSRVVY